MFELAGAVIFVGFLLVAIILKCFFPNKKLVILDLNGVLIHRERRDGTSLPPPPGAQQLSRFNVWVHPDATTILDSLATQGFDIAIWSSVRSENVKEILPLFNWDASRYRFIWTQEDCVVNGEHPLKPGVPNFTKPLSKVWKCFPEYNASNTVIVDDSDVKIEGFEKNHLHVATWTPREEDLVHVWWEKIKC